MIVDGYKWYGNNRTNLHTNARRGSGGVGCFVKNDIFLTYDVQILDANTDGIMWISLTPKATGECICICICYLPPENSTRAVDAESFFATLMEQIYIYQNTGKIIICGDFNSRCGLEQDIIEGVDDVMPREILDENLNSHGNHFLDLLTDTNFCMLNGRVGTNDFTSVSYRGLAVVDYVIGRLHLVPKFVK